MDLIADGEGRASVKAKVSEILNFYQAGFGDGIANWGVARARLNTVAVAWELPTLADADLNNGAVMRSKLNTIVEALNAGGMKVARLVSQYREIALRASQAGFGSPLDQSGNYNDPQINTALFPPTWQAAQTVAANAYRSPTTPNGKLYKTTSGGGGATGASEPIWPTTIGGTVVDGAITWTCERGPWFTAASGQLHIASIEHGLLPALGNYVMPSLSWDMTNGDSLVISIRQAWHYANDSRTDLNESSVIGNRHANTARRGIQIVATASVFGDLRFFVGDGVTGIGSGHVKAAFARKPGDGTARSTIFMVDGLAKRTYAYADKIAYQQADMFDGANLSPHDRDISSITGSTATANNFFLGGLPGTNASYDFGITALDVMVLPAQGLGSTDARQDLINYLADLS